MKKNDTRLQDNISFKPLVIPAKAGAFSRMNILIFWKKAHRAVSSLIKTFRGKLPGIQGVDRTQANLKMDSRLRGNDKNLSNSTLLRIFLIVVLLLGCFAPLVWAQQPAAPAGQSSPDPTVGTILFADGLLENAILRKKVVETIFVILLGYLLMFGFIGIINKRVKEIKIRHSVRKNIIYFVSITLIIIVFFIWIQNINSITIFLGVAGAGLALALQEAILCVAGWMLILMRHPFEAGDRIEINGTKGDVIDIRLFQTSLLEIGNWVDADQSTGRIVNIPNSFVFKYENYNYSRGFEFIWHEIPILLTFESDWKRGKEIMMTHGKNLAEGLEEKVSRKIDAMRNRYMIYYGKLTPIVYVNIKDSGVELTLRYLTEAKKRRSTQDSLCQAILDDFEKEPNVNFAYPTYRIVKT